MLVLTILQSGCLREGPAERVGLAATLQHGDRQCAQLAFHQGHEDRGTDNGKSSGV